MTERTEIELNWMERRLNAIRMTDSERLVAMAAMRKGFIIVERFAWLAHKITQIGATLFSKPRLARTIIENQHVLTASHSTSVSDAARMMKQSKAAAILVCDKQRLVGVFTERDALFRVTAEEIDPKTTLLADVMTPNPQTIDPDKPLGHALHMMYEGGFRNVPVVENGQPIGMVSARDALGPELKAFVSEMDQREHIAEILG